MGLDDKHNTAPANSAKGEINLIFGESDIHASDAA
jgi:hypothetical protein